ncbi:hypothetical protein [Helicobacter pylori]|uniref:hypothetical protein n=1 Tax=Helicobacter pylori TaxID=210 RepID=UPI003BB00C2B
MQECQKRFYNQIQSKELKQAITSQNLAYLMRIELIIIKITYYLLYIYYNSLTFKKEKFNLRINH